MWDAIEPRLRELAKRAGLRDVPPAAVAAVLVVCACAVGWAAWRWWPTPASGGEAGTLVESEEFGSQPASSAVAASAEPTTPATVLVHVAGCVRHPGVYELAAGSRVVDAIEAAGGMLGDAVDSAVNLARTVTDGEQIVIPDEDDAPSPAAAGGGAPSAGGAPVSGAAAAPVNINTADAAALDTLPGVGPSTAAKIVADREANGPFASPEDLGRVSGIGPKKLEALKDLVCVR